MEATTHLFRTLANRRRLRLLRLLAVLEECRVKQLIDATGVPAGAVSNDLRRLSSCGVIWRRRSGGAVYYRLAEEPSHPLTQAAIAYLTRAFRHIRERDPRLVAACDQASSPDYSDAAIFACFTAFTHPRRLQIIRCLSEQGKMDQTALAVELHMSHVAASRHVEKLAARALIRKQKDDRSVACELVSGGDSPRSALFQAVVDTLHATGG